MGHRHGTKIMTDNKPPVRFDLSLATKTEMEVALELRRIATKIETGLMERGFKIKEMQTDKALYEVLSFR